MIFRYLHGTSNYVICDQGRHRPKKILDVHGFIDDVEVGDFDH